MATSGSKITWNVGVDWDNDSFIHLYARPTDRPNLFGAQAVNVSTMPQVVGPGGSIAYTDNVIDTTSYAYGKRRAVWTTGTTVGTYYYLGWNGSVYTVNLPAGNIVGSVWIRSLNPAYNSVPVNFILRNSAGVNVAASSNTVATTDGWKRLTVTYNNPVATTGALGFGKPTGAAAVYEIAGPMIVHQVFGVPALPAGFNSGATSQYDNITEHIRSMRWSNNYNQPYQVLPPVGRCNLVMNNPSGLFSPENSGSPIAALLRPKRALRIYATNPATGQPVMYAGWIDAIRPTVMKSLPTVTIDASDIRNFLEDREPFMSLHPFGTSARYLAVDIIDALNLPNQSVPSVLDRPASIPSDEQVFVYPLAALVGKDALDALAEIAGAEVAHIFFSRSGDFRWYKIQDFKAYNWAVPSVPPDFTIDNSIMIDAEYTFGEYITNEVTVTSRKRKVTTATDKILWEADATITLAANEYQEFKVNYKNPDSDNEKQIVAINPYLEITKAAGINHTVTFSHSNALITLKNTTAGALNVTVLRVRGQKVILWNETESTKQHTSSIQTYGKVKRRIDYPLIQDQKRARGLANYWVTRFQAPSGIMRSVTFTTQTGRPEVENAMLQLTYMNEVLVADLATGHNRRYKIIGEEFNVYDGLRSVECRWYLEPTYDGPYPYELAGVETS